MFGEGWLAERRGLVAIMLFGAVRSDTAFCFACVRYEMLVEVGEGAAQHHAMRTTNVFPEPSRTVQPTALTLLRADSARPWSFRRLSDLHGDQYTGRRRC